jgi:hypothetical protein
MIIPHRMLSPDPRSRGSPLVALFFCIGRFIPRTRHAQRITHEAVPLLPSHELTEPRLLHLSLHQHDRGKQGQHHSSRWDGRRPFVAWDGLLLRLKIETALPLDKALHEEADHGQHGQGGNPCGLLHPDRRDGCRIFAPPAPRFDRTLLLLVGLQNRGL